MMVMGIRRNWVAYEHRSIYLLLQTILELLKPRTDPRRTLAVDEHYVEKSDEEVQEKPGIRWEFFLHHCICQLLQDVHREVVDTIGGTFGGEFDHTVKGDGHWFLCIGIFFVPRPRSFAGGDRGVFD
jgi:hypothetical protein